MRAFIFFTMVLGLISLGIWVNNQKTIDASNIYIPMIEDLSIGGEAIVSKEEWGDILVGKWSFYTKFNYESNIETFHGEIEYKADGNFVRYVTYKKYNSAYDYNKSNPSIVAGGSLSGAWELNADETWNEDCQKCNITVSYGHSNKNICQVFFSPKKINIYGNVNTNFSKSVLKKFNKTQISIEQRSYSAGRTHYFDLYSIR